METFTSLKPLVENSVFPWNRKEKLQKLDLTSIDPPIRDIISDISKCSWCFTLQSCYGHFLCDGNKAPFNINPLPNLPRTTPIEYKIAYIAFFPLWIALPFLIRYCNKKQREIRVEELKIPH